jgi:hypothetical protein
LATSNTEKRYTKAGLWQLFVATATPLHLWAIILILMDISWVAERTNYWDAIGVASYGLMFALVESLLLWGLLVLAGFILPKAWPESKRITLLGILIISAALWAMLGQLYFLLELSFPKSLIDFLAGQAHPLWFLYAGLLAVVGLTVLLLAYFAVFSEKFQRGFTVLIEHLSPLMGLYVFLDGVGILIVLIRNLG